MSTDDPKFIHNRERFADTEEMLRTLLDGFAKQLFTAHRGILSQDGDGHTTQGRIAVKGIVMAPDGTTKYVELPQLEDVAVHFPNGGGYSFTHPSKGGDEGTFLFHRTAIDAWQQNGGVQNPVSRRLFSLSDATFIPGGRSDPRRLKGVSQVSSQHRADNGEHFADVHQENGVTHQSRKMVLATVGDSSSHVVTADNVRSSAGKVLLNC